MTQAIDRQKGGYRYEWEESLALQNRLVVRTLFQLWERSCKAPNVNHIGAMWVLWGDIFSELAEDVSQEVLDAWRNVYLVFGILAYDSFSDHYKAVFLLAVARWRKTLGIDYVELTYDQIKLLEKTMNTVHVPYTDECSYFRFADVESKKPEGFDEKVRKRERHTEHLVHK